MIVRQAGHRAKCSPNGGFREFMKQNIAQVTKLCLEEAAARDRIIHWRLLPLGHILVANWHYACSTGIRVRL
jgi:hypothetical protein